MEAIAVEQLESVHEAGTMRVGRQSSGQGSLHYLGAVEAHHDQWL